MIDLMRKHIFLLLLILVVSIIIFVTTQNDDQPVEKMVVERDGEQEAESGPEESVVFVDIKGEVVTPGVYAMETGDRVKDVVLEAGGFTKEADENFINLAQKVLDEMVIIVPTKGAVESQESRVSGESKLRINHATVDEIQQLPGIGPSKAKAIVEYRDEHGYFNKVEDLLEVSGIGEKTLEALIEEIHVP
ncbi:helix-hairpin-helix domain-containing protein [Ornithinibacillus scapharcae]|uniref:helix-hairpin-helix domain-containing protein n=1 Tax=Ornithinibacillus scapharcae TaxID=1147159 RepID=UPI000225B7CA|nr:helix-hairpin-helix domain-containing protein [Ornithinibacillus scapharcae]